MPWINRLKSIKYTNNGIPKRELVEGRKWGGKEEKQCVLGKGQLGGNECFGSFNIIIFITKPKSLLTLFSPFESIPFLGSNSYSFY